MYPRHFVFKEVTALHRCPCYACLTHFLIGFALTKLVYELFRNIDMECLGQQAHVIKGRNRLDTRNYRDCYSRLAAGVPECIKPGVVKKHLCDHILRAGIDLSLKVQKVYFQVGSFKMLFGIPCNTYTESGR